MECSDDIVTANTIDLAACLYGSQRQVKSESEVRVWESTQRGVGHKPHTHTHTPVVAFSSDKRRHSGQLESQRLQNTTVESDTTEQAKLYTMAKIDRLMDVVRIGGDDVRIPASPTAWLCACLNYLLCGVVGMVFLCGHTFVQRFKTSHFLHSTHSHSTLTLTPLC